MRVYYNEIDRHCCQWLSNLMREGLIPKGDIDDRSITEVQPSDLDGYDQCHFFAGIAGWAYALDLAGWDGPVWTGSCPCTPLSSAAHGRHTAHDLWPAWFGLIKAGQTHTIFGEQVANRAWFDRLCDDVETVDYEIRAAVLPATSTAHDHARPRLFYVCDTDSNRESICAVNGKTSWVPKHRYESSSMVREDGLSGVVARVRSGFGNAIVPQVAAEFVKAVMDC